MEYLITIAIVAIIYVWEKHIRKPQKFTLGQGPDDVGTFDRGHRE